MSVPMEKETLRFDVMVISKRETNRLERRAKIIAVARDHFFTHGFAGTAMSAISAKLGGSKRTLWTYFPSKEALFEAVVEDTSAAIRKQIDYSCSDKDPMIRLTRLCRSIIDNAVSPLSMGMCRIMYSEAPRQPEVARIFHERGAARAHQVLADCLAKHFDDILTEADLPEAAHTLMALCVAGVHADLLTGIKSSAPPEDRERDAQMAAKVILRTYAKNPDPGSRRHPAAPDVLPSA